MFKQTEQKYKSIKMGLGSGSIYDFGCYLVSLTNGLVEKGHDFTPESLNEFLKEKGAWTGEFKNYINVDRLDDILPDIFISYEKIEPWNDIKQLEKFLNDDCIVIGKLDARPIGGSGTHFALITKVKNNNAYIFDPWFGDEIKVADRYNKYGNILSLRVFYLKKGNSMPSENWIIQNSDKWRGLIIDVLELGNPETTPLDKVKSVIAGLRSRATDMEKKATFWETEAKNRSEQVSRLKDQLLNEVELRKDLSAKLNQTIENAGGISTVYEKQLNSKQGVIDDQAETIGSLNHEVSELEIKLKSEQKKTDIFVNAWRKLIYWIRDILIKIKERSK